MKSCKSTTPENSTGNPNALRMEAEMSGTDRTKQGLGRFMPGLVALGSYNRA